MMTHEERFWSRVQRCQHGKVCRRCCWPWQGPRLHNGYDIIYVAALEGSMVAHCYAIELTHGALLLNHRDIYTLYGPVRSLRTGPALFLGTHRCDNPPCCNPSHICIGTHGDNARDARNKGRLRPRKSSATFLLKVEGVDSPEEPACKAD